MSKRLIAVGIFALALAAVAMAADDPFVGTWKLDPRKSGVTGPGTVFKSCTIKIEHQGNGGRFTWRLVDSDGKAAQGEFAGQYNGKDYGCTDPDCDTLSLKRIGANTLVYSFKKGGKEVESWRSVISTERNRSEDMVIWVCCVDFGLCGHCPSRRRSIHGDMEVEFG
jgi:hypothetical protein